MPVSSPLGAYDCQGRADGRTEEHSLVVPEEIILATWRALRLTAEASCEGVVLWAAPKRQYAEAQQIVTTVVVPQQRVSPGRYELPTVAVREMGKALRRHNLVNVAQLHSHPSDWVDHSRWDDAHAFSLRNGALSIIWPGYASEIPSLRTWGVHECWNHNWRRLEPQEVTWRITVVPLVVDLRIELLKFERELEDE